MIAGAALIGAVAACGGSTPSAAPVYGAPAADGPGIPTDLTELPDGGATDTPAAAPTTGQTPPPNSVQPLYGMPPE